jgi:hypothetical protein
MSTGTQRRHPRRTIRAMIAPVVIAAYLPVLALTAPPAAATPTSNTFSTPGGPYPYVVPAGVTSIHVDAVGGGGGHCCNAPVGGAAGHVSADLPATAGSTVYVYVAGNGGNNSTGINGGGSSGLYAGGGRR